MMGAVDKVCIGTAAIMGLREDLNLQGQEYSVRPLGLLKFRQHRSDLSEDPCAKWTSSSIYFGAILAVYPTLIASEPDKVAACHALAGLTMSPRQSAAHAGRKVDVGQLYGVGHYTMRLSSVQRLWRS